MLYTNDIIERLIKERDAKIREYDSKIEREIEKEKAKRKFSWSGFLLVMFIFASPLIINFILHLNKTIFPPTSIWSWNYWIK